MQQRMPTGKWPHSSSEPSNRKRWIDGRRLWLPFYGLDPGIEAIDQDYALRTRERIEYSWLAAAAIGKPAMTIKDGLYSERFISLAAPRYFCEMRRVGGGSIARRPDRFDLSREGGFKRNLAGERFQQPPTCSKHAL